MLQINFYTKLHMGFSNQKGNNFYFLNIETLNEFNIAKIFIFIISYLTNQLFLNLYQPSNIIIIESRNLKVG